MANNYTQFSFMLEIPKGCTEKAKQWFDDTLTRMETEEWQDQYSSLTLEFCASEGVWVWDGGESGDVEAAIAVTQSFLKTMNIEQGIYFGWANTCSKPRLNEFSGGGVVVTKDHEPIISGSYDCCREASDAGIEVVE